MTMIIVYAGLDINEWTASNLNFHFMVQVARTKIDAKPDAKSLSFR